MLFETPALDAAPDLATWAAQHPDERVKDAAYDYEYETQGLWCQASVAEFAFPGGIKVTRRAFFYVPTAAPAAPLPHQGPGLIQHCRLRALWYQVSNPADPGGLAKSVSGELSTALGLAEEPPRFQGKDNDWGSGMWGPYMIWERAKRRIVLAVDPGGPIPDPRAHTRLLVIARSPSAPRGSYFDWMGNTPKGQPALKDAPEIARVAKVEKPCAFGGDNWQNGLISFGQKLLQDFPASRWAPYVHLTLARTYASKLLFTYPGVELEGANKPANPNTLRREAIVHFRAFLDSDPKSPEAASAWRETWRLLAGLPPSPIHFGCSD